MNNSLVMNLRYIVGFSSIQINALYTIVLLGIRYKIYNVLFSWKVQEKKSFQSFITRRSESNSVKSQNFLLKTQ